MKLKLTLTKKELFAERKKDVLFASSPNELIIAVNSTTRNSATY